MQHRHLTHERYTLAAIDDIIIARGKRRDWAELRQAALADRSLFEKVLRVCQAHVADPYAQRYHFWKHYAERHLGAEQTIRALRLFDQLYPQPNDESALQQLRVQLANPLPYDLEELNLVEYKNLDPRWHDWQTVRAVCVDCATLIFDQIVGLED